MGRGAEQALWGSFAAADRRRALLMRRLSSRGKNTVPFLWAGKMMGAPMLVFSRTAVAARRPPRQQEAPPLAGDALPPPRVAAMKTAVAVRIFRHAP